jgi:hypothetical protein
MLDKSAPKRYFLIGGIWAIRFVSALFTALCIHSQHWEDISIGPMAYLILELYLKVANDE